MTTATTENLRELAKRYQPVLAFSAGERMFPALVESYLSHVSLATWNQIGDAGVPGEPINGPNHRGTAIMNGAPPGTKLAGAPNSAGHPLPLDSSGIGNPAYRPGSAPETLFLTFGGWSDATHTRGSPDYLLAAFSELSAALEPANTWREFESLPNRPHIWVDQPTTPTVYAEAEWGGMYLSIYEAGGAANGDFAATDKDPDLGLRQVLALTYYLFFPLREPNNPDVLVGDGFCEGQWEAVTIFFPGMPGASRGPSAPPEFEYQEPPLAVALSRSRDVTNSLSSCRPWDWPFVVPAGTPPPVQRDGLHPRLYVSLGRHELLFAPPEDQAANYQQGGPAGGASQETRLKESDPGQEDFPGFEPLLIGLVLPFPLNLFALIAWLFTVFAGLNNDEYEGAHGPPDDISTPEGDGRGPVAAPADGSVPPGAVLADGTRIDDPAITLLRFIDNFRLDPQRTAWPYDKDPEDPGAPPPEFEYPYWWDFAGCWGVIIAGGIQWASGTRRIDRFGRSLGYWNAVNLARAWAEGTVARPPKSI